MLIEFTWAITSVNTTSNTMIVEYLPTDGEASSLNMPIPYLGQSIDDHVKKYAPVTRWRDATQNFATVAVGTQGSAITDMQLLTPAEKARGLRASYLRAEVDSINAVRWNTMSDQEKSNWTAYRQALLDVPQQPGFPDNIVWPTIPV